MDSDGIDEIHVLYYTCPPKLISNRFALYGHAIIMAMATAANLSRAIGD